MDGRSNGSPGNKRHNQTLRLGQLPWSRGWEEKQPHDPLLSQWTAPPFYLYTTRIKVWGLHIKQTGAFDVDGNTNTDLSRVVTAYLFPLVIHWALVECVCLQRAAACTSGTVAKEAVRGPWSRVGCGKAIWLPVPLDLILIYWLYMGR